MSTTLVQRMAALGLVRFPEAIQSPSTRKTRRATPQRNAGSRFPTKLSDEQVRQIRQRWLTHDRVKDIARDFGVTFAYVSMIGTGRRRSRVQETPQ